MPELRLVPVDWSTARQFVAAWHRHHRPPVGYRFAVGVANRADVLVGVAIAGRPVASAFADGLTLEVTRVAQDGTPNAGSMLYGATARAAWALGYRRLITYTQADESGASLRGAGWRIIAQRPARPGWSTPARPRIDHGVDHIARTLWEAVNA